MKAKVITPQDGLTVSSTLLSTLLISVAVSSGVDWSYPALQSSKLFGRSLLGSESADLLFMRLAILVFYFLVSMLYGPTRATCIVFVLLCLSYLSIMGTPELHITEYELVGGLTATAALTSYTLVHIFILLLAPVNVSQYDSAMWPFLFDAPIACVLGILHYVLLLFVVYQVAHWAYAFDFDLATSIVWYTAVAICAGKLTVTRRKALVRLSLLKMRSGAV